MTPERWQAIEALFEAGVDLAPSDRALLFDRACAGDTGLRLEVESLLRAEERSRASDFIAELIAVAARDCRTAGPYGEPTRRFPDRRVDEADRPGKPFPNGH